MPDRPPPSPSSVCRQLLAVASLSVLGLSVSQAGALSPVQADPSPKLLQINSGSVKLQEPSAQDQAAPLADLDEVLEAIRTKLEELTEATAIAAANSRLREELEGLKKDNQSLTAELAQATSRRSELESASALVAARIAELTEAAEAARREAARREAALTQLQQEKDQLSLSVTLAQTAREGAEAKAKKIEAEMANKLKEATDAAARAEAELVAAKEQLGQAAGAAIEAERARHAARSEADARQGEAARARQELAAARAEIHRITSTNAQVEQRIAALEKAAMSATETARHNLATMAEKIAALNAALDSSGSEDAAQRRAPQAEPDQEAEQPATATRATSQPPAPEAASPTAAGQPSNGATSIATVQQAAAPREAELVPSRFQADIEALNDLELSASGKDLFSGITSVSGHAVDVGTTTAWASLPPIGQQSYLESLLDRWVAERGGEGPAVVRIVDESGRVLVEKARP